MSLNELANQFQQELNKLQFNYYTQQLQQNTTEQNEVKNLINLLNQAHFSKDNTILSQSTNALNTLLKQDPISTLKKLFNIIILLLNSQNNQDLIQFFQIQNINELALASCIFANTAMSKLISYYILQNPQDLIELLAQVFYLLFFQGKSQSQNPNTTPQQKNQLQTCLTSISNCVSYLLNFAEHFNKETEIFQMVTQYLQIQFQGNDSYNVYQSFQIYKSLYTLLFSKSDIELCTKNFFPSLLVIIESSMQYFQNITQQYSQQQQNNINTINEKELYSNLSIVQAMTDNILILVQKIEKQRPQDLQEFTQNQKILNFFYSMLNLGVSTHLQNSCSILCLNQNKNIQKKSNFIKYNILKITSILTLYYQKHEKNYIQSQLNDSQQSLQNFDNFLFFLQEALNLILPQLKTLLQQKNNNNQVYNLIDLLKDEFDLYQQFNQLLQTLLETLHLQKFYDYYSQNYQNLTLDILLPLLNMNQNQYQDYGQNPEEFINYQNDLVSQRSSSIYQTIAAEILFSLSDKIDGCLFWTFQKLCELLSPLLQNNSNQNIQQQNNNVLDFFQFLNNPQQQNTLYLTTQFSQQEQINILLLSMNILSPQILKRPDFLNSLESFSKNLLQYFQLSNDGITIIRITQFYKHFLSHLFQSNEMYFSGCIQTILQKLLSYQTLDSIVLQALDTLWELSQQPENEYRMESALYDVLGTMQTMVKQIQIPNFFEYLEFLVEYYSQALNNNITSLVQELTQRFIQEYQKETLKQQNYKTNGYITKILDIFIKITSNNDYMDEAIMFFQDQVYDIVSYIKFVEFIGFDLQLMEIMANVLQKTYETDTILDIIDNCIDDIYQKYADNDIEQISYFLYVFTQYCHPQIIDNYTRLNNKLIDLALKYYENINLKNLTYEYKDFCHISLLLQIYTQYFIDIYENSQVSERFIIKILKIYQQILNSNLKVYPVKLIQVIMLILAKYPQQTIRIFSEYDKNNNSNNQNNSIFPILLNSFIQDYQQNYTNTKYDRNILISTLIALIKNVQFCNFNQTQLLSLLNCLISQINKEIYQNSNEQEQENQQQYQDDYDDEKQNNFDYQEEEQKQNNNNIFLSDKITSEALDQKLQKQYYQSNEDEVNQYLHQQLDQLPLNKYDSMEEFKTLIKFLQDLKTQNNIDIFQLLSKEMLSNIEEIINFKIVQKQGVLQNDYNQSVVRKIIKVQKHQQKYESKFQYMNDNDMDI